MRRILADADSLLRGTGDFAPRRAAPGAWRRCVLLVIVFAPIYGALMGSYRFDGPDRLLQVLYSGVKLPLLLLVTTALCLPGFFVLNTALGLRDDFGRALRAVVASQGALSIALASLGPVTRFFYFSTESHRAALLINIAMFTAATLAGQAVMLRHYVVLIRGDRRHTLMLIAWVGLFAFVGIQMGWTLRPFVGAPGLPASFFRDEPFTNAYEQVARLFFRF